VNSHIAIVDCAIEDQAIQCFNQFVSKYNMPCTYHLPSLFGMSSLVNTSDNASMYFILGSYSHVHQKLDWQIKLSNFVKEKIEQRTPVVGICFGHQLIADSFGGTIGPVLRGTEFDGYRKISILNNKWNLEENETFELIVSHKEEILTLPTSFEHIASSDECKYDIVCHKNYPYLGLQSHPEASLNFILNGLDKKIEDNKLSVIQKDSERIMTKILNYIKTKIN